MIRVHLWQSRSDVSCRRQSFMLNALMSLMWPIHFARRNRQLWHSFMIMKNYMIPLDAVAVQCYRGAFLDPLSAKKSYSLLWVQFEIQFSICLQGITGMLILVTLHEYDIKLNKTNFADSWMISTFTCCANT